MRIVMFSNNYLPILSGVATSIVLFRRGLIEAGHEVHLVVPQYNSFEDEEPYVFRIPALDLSEQLQVSLAMPFRAPIEVTMRGIKPDVIHSHHPIWLGDMAADFAQDLGVPLVFTFHTRYDAYAQEYVSLVPDLAEVVMQELVGRYLERCAHVVAPTVSIRDFIRRKYDAETPVTVVPTPVDLTMYRDLEPQRIRQGLGLDDAEMLLYMGRLAGEKNLDFLLRAFAQVAAERPQARLVLLGEGPAEDELREMTQRMGLDGRVILAGSVPHADVPHYATAADLFVFASVTETQGLVLMEAMAAGTPVVAVEAPGSVDMLAQGGGVLVKPREDDFSDAVLRLLADKSDLQQMGERAAQAVQRYAVPSVTDRLLEVYEAAVAAGPRRSG
jgi:1,2-diacylglycerol 3-alpha-glucosyltransferase